MIHILLEHYYDPRYDHARLEYEGKFFDIVADNPSEAAEKLVALMEELSFYPNKIVKNHF
jgi:tRNA 2-selenouridine synthase